MFDVKDNKLLYAINNKYNIVKKIIIDEDIKTTFEEYGDFKISFICEPFYYATNEKAIILTKESVIYNNGDLESKPNIKIYATGTVQLTINNETIQVKDINEYVEIDSKLLLCLNADKTSKNKDYIGDFITLDKGKNKVSWTGDVTKVEILPRTIYY